MPGIAITALPDVSTLYDPIYKQPVVRSILLLLLLSCFSVQAQQRKQLPVLTQLRCEYLEDPIGIDVQWPRLSWEITAGGRNIRQQAYEVMVSSSLVALQRDSGDLWSTGKQVSDSSAGIVYNGRLLKSGEACYWKVRVWTSDGRLSAWSTPARWQVGLLQAGDWHAHWIGLDSAFSWDQPRTAFTRLSARYLRKDFRLKGKVKTATAYISGVGLYELYINGSKTGRDVLAPGPTEYNKRVLYNTFDVTQQLQQGNNTIGAILGNGRFFAMRTNPDGTPPMADFGYPRMICQLHIIYTDGTTAEVITDNTWQVTSAGPAGANNEYDGEEYDATREMPGWNMPGYPATSWLQASPMTAPEGKLVAQMNNNIRVMDTVKTQTVKEIRPGVFIFDMGQNLVGWVRLKVTGARGTRISLRFAERLTEDGSLYLANLRSAKVTDTYILKGGGPESWEPRFTYHGFRYVEVVGYPGKPDLSAIEGRVVYDDMETTGHFETSNEVINQVYKNAYWGIRGNYRGMPTDCPQRDERMGWLGDRAVGARGESFIFGNHLLYAKWLQDIEDAQRADGSIPDVAPSYWKIYSDNMTWPAAYPIIANLLYEQFGDDQPIRRHYASMKKWMAYMKDKYMKDYILAKDTYGDWCMPPESPELIHSNDPARKTDGDFLGTAFYYHILTLMERFAAITGNTVDAIAFRELSEKVKTAFNNKFLNITNGYYANNTPTANIFSLAYQLAPVAQQQSVFRHITDKTLHDYKGHISTGLVGAQWLMRTLTSYGRGDIACQLATNTTYPSWGYMAKEGATTIWELWNGNTADPAMNSGNHVMLLGDLVVWYYENLGGIRPDTSASGYKKMIMKPLVTGDLTFVKTAYHSYYGRISSHWTKTAGLFNWRITIPVNTRATIYVPAPDAASVMESGVAAATAPGVQFLKYENGYAVYEAGSGEYRFTVR